MPGGHLATSVALSAAAYAYNGSTTMAAGAFIGGFLIDADHYLDYLAFEGQWKKPGPGSFLRYYFTLQPLRLVLPLHSIELTGALALFNYFKPSALLTGYLLGALMHLVFDVLVNGDHVLKRPVLFYSFVYRARQSFSAAALLDPVDVPATAVHPFRDFFLRWMPHQEKKAEASNEQHV